MRKQILFGLAIALFVAVAPAAAQDEEAGAVSCTPEEIATTVDIITELSAPYQEMAAGIDMSEPNTLTAAVAGFDYLSTGFWNDVYPTIPACLEAGTLGYNFGLALDESVISAGLARLALYEAEHGDPELAQSLVENAQIRADWNAQIVEATFGQMGETGEIPEEMFSYELEACTTEDTESEAVTAMNESLATYNELSNALVDATNEDLSAIIASYADLSGVYWSEIYPELPACSEISEFGYNVGLVYNEQIITLMLTRLAAYEEEFGSPDTAAIFIEAAAARQELAKAFIEAAFPQAEAEEE